MRITYENGSLFFGKRMEKALHGKLESEILDLKKICETA